MAKHSIRPLAALVVLGMALGLSPQNSTAAVPLLAQVTPVKPVVVSALRPGLSAPTTRPSQPAVVRTPPPPRVAASRPTPTVQARPTSPAATPTPKVEALYVPKALVKPLVAVVVRPLPKPSGTVPLPSIAPLE